MDQTVENIDKLRRQLFSTKIAERKKVVKKIVIDKLTVFQDDLFNLFKIEYNKNKSWEFICLLIDTLGILNYKNAANELLKICKKNESHDMITICASRAYCRIKRKNLEDASPILKMLSFGNFSVVDGALKALGEDKMILSENDQNEIINCIQKFEPKLEKGFSDIRMGLVAACENWKKTPKINCFLKECIESQYQPLIKIAKNSLK